ncbi:MAG: alpha-amylase family glycosyl hydrolase, partial [Anaerolineae bacterium]
MVHKPKRVLMEFHVSRQARDRYQFDESLFSLSGNVIFANFYAARVFAEKMNDKRDLVSFPEQAVKAGQINAMGLLDEISHLVVQAYRQQRNPQAMRQALAWLYEELGQEAVDATLLKFAAEFPPLAVYRRQATLADYVEGETAGVPHRELVLEEMLMLWLANANPAFAPFLELFDDDALARGTEYTTAIASLYDFFDTQPPFGADNQNLIDMLRAPALAHPHSLSAQLEFIRQRWGVLLGKYLYRLLSSLDLIQEEEKAIFVGPGPALVPEYGALEVEPERFSRDRDWMPHLVLMAKNTYVWLHQLSQAYRQPITRLDQIPDEELDRLARWGFTGLWLIGLWERSPASRQIKQLCGNPEAVASAYSLYDYQIAADLGGSEAYQNLRQRAWQRGIRLASDMVPNHVGIYSRWVVEHPDWFVSLEHSPFPSYSFDGPDLSEDERVGIFVEDHYYDRSDAAVVFKRVDRWTGSEKYIYHGNDGTSMPWNDTAQLNYLNPEVREAVIQTILHVARQFPIIRFDAAMTLAKTHFQRLWFPEPGTGGAIPTRAEHGLTKAQFDAAMPQEFWREVVDRVAAEAPDTLLLAEAFWLLEGYFVRTLGMHRVYNSAFMNMLRDEDNAKYRSVIKNTLEFDPEILKRFVSFMNNPDEETAVAQFGKGDKYFGICTMMATLPGLPMFGHGQIEGLAEKYGMEYRRAYWDEKPDSGLVDRHRREIFPLLHRRYLFAEVQDFRLYDFYSGDGGSSGSVNEDVFAYSNRAGGERALVVYHNRYATARGWIRASAAYSVKAGDGGDRVLVQTSLGDGLGLRGDGDRFYIFRDAITGLEYIRSGRGLHEDGLYVELDAYKCHVFVDWREVQDNEWHQYAHLADYLGGRGVPSIEEALREVFLQPVHYPFKELVNGGHFRWL